MNPSLLEQVESFRLKLEKATELTPQLKLEYDLMLSALTASIESYASFCASLSRLEKSFNKETNELCVTKNFLNQVVKGKHYGNSSIPGEIHDQRKGKS